MASSKAKDYLLGIDIGTSSTKALLCTTRGALVAEETSPHPIHSPRPGWNEQDPEDWWAATVAATRKLLRKTKIRPDHVRAIGLSGQMHGSVFLDVKGHPLRRALLWNDQRTFKECDEILAATGGLKGVLSMVNNNALTGFTAPKILWFRANEPAKFRRLKKVLLPKDYIRLKLTGDYATDVADASGTLLLDVKRRAWSAAMLDCLHLDLSLLPPVFESPEITGTLTEGAAKALGLTKAIPVVAGAGDQPAAAVGMGVVRSGIVSATIGTSGVVFAHSDKMVPNPKGILQSFCHAVPDRWCVFGCMLSAGGSFEWLRETLYPQANGVDLFSEMTRAAETAEPGSGGLIFLPYLDGERCPHPDPKLRGGWIGLNRHHDLASMTRATMEGITFGMRDQILLLGKLGVKVSEVRCAGGGAKSDFWMQLQADTYDAPTMKVDTANASAMGAALLAGVGIGAWRSVVAASEEAVHATGRKAPRKKWSRFYRDHHSIYRELAPALKNTFQKLSAHL